METGKSVNSRQLALTARGASWIAQFEPEDRGHAVALLESLTLVSHDEFERKLLLLIDNEARLIDGPVALFAVREFSPTASYFGEGHEPIDAIGNCADVGSEARVANLIRNISRSDTSKFLNHPNVVEMRAANCRGIFVVDDLIGSGGRTLSFLNSMWHNKSLRAWHSLKYISLVSICYAVLGSGQKRVQKAPYGPKLVFYKHCPTFRDMPWPRRTKSEIISTFLKYGSKSSRKQLSLGYNKDTAAIIFEHGCPNNCPSIYWAPATVRAAWTPLFPNRTVLVGETSAFPEEIQRREPPIVMIQAGQRRLASSRSLVAPGAVGVNLLVIMALVSKGVRSRAALSYASSLGAAACNEVIEECVTQGLLTPTLRLTEVGARELDDAKRHGKIPEKVADRGSDIYYPSQLRRSRS